MRSGVGYPSYALDPTWAVVSGAFSSDYPVTNLADLKKIRTVGRATTSAEQKISFTFPANRSIQFAALVHHNAPYGAGFRLYLFSDTNPDPVGNAVAIVHDTGALSVWTSDPGTLIFTRTRPIYLSAAVTARSGLLVLDSRAGVDATAWEIGGVELGGWWEWTRITVPREFGLQNRDGFSQHADGVRHGMLQFSARTWSGTRDMVTDSETDGTLADFMHDRGLTKPFVFNWDVDDAVTWARESMLVRNARLSPPTSQHPDAFRAPFSLIEHLA